MPSRLERATWEAMLKFGKLEHLTELEWKALGWLTLIDRGRIFFGPDNCRWATTTAERADNVRFYKSVYKSRKKESSNAD